MDKKLLILGSDFGTYDLVTEARRMGIYTIVADTMETSPTKEAADEAWQISTTDYETLEKKIAEENVNAILAGASEFNLENVRYLCHKLGLPVYCDSDEAWSVARNKGKFKSLCKKHGVPVAQDYKLTDELSREELDQIVYPVVVKPVDMSGNRGVSFCANEEELVAGYKEARELSSNDNIIVERQLNGPEFTGYYVLADGEVSLSYYTSAHHQKGELHNLYTLEDITDHRLKQYMDEVNEGLKKVFKEAGCREGVCWIECMYDDDGHFYVLEMGYRLAGPVLYVMYEKCSGFNTMRWQIETAFGVKHTPEMLPAEPPVFKQCVASYNLFTNQAGVVHEFVGLDRLLAMDNILVDFPKREGGEVRYHANMGVIRIFAENAQELCDTVAKINSFFFINNEKGENMFIKFDSFDEIIDEYEEGLKEFNL